MTATRIVGAAAAVALLLSLTACGNGDKPSTSSSTPEPGAIDKLWEAAYSGVEEDDWEAKQMEVEELVAECMADEGFEYIPVDYPGMDDPVPVEPVGEDGEDLQWGTLEFAKKYGYGMTTNPYGDGGKVSTMPIEGDGEEWVDPNQEYLESMSETERTAYYEALSGPQPDEDTDWENWNPTWEEMGCQGWAQHEVYGDQMWGGDPEDNEWADLQKEMETMYTSMETDPRVTEAVEKWSACMADAGYPGMAALMDGENSINEKVNAIYEEGDPWKDLGPDATQEDYEAADREMQKLLAAISPEEIKTATADFTCREKVDYQDIYNQVNLDVQQQFYDAHKAELEAYVEAMTAGTKG